MVAGVIDERVEEAGPLWLWAADAEVAADADFAGEAEGTGPRW